MSYGLRQGKVAREEVEASSSDKRKDDADTSHHVGESGTARKTITHTLRLSTHVRVHLVEFSLGLDTTTD